MVPAMVELAVRPDVALGSSKSIGIRIFKFEELDE